MAELVDAYGSGPYGATRGSSSLPRSIFNINFVIRRRALVSAEHATRRRPPRPKGVWILFAHEIQRESQLLAGCIGHCLACQKGIYASYPSFVGRVFAASFSTGPAADFLFDTYTTRDLSVALLI